MNRLRRYVRKRTDLQNKTVHKVNIEGNTLPIIFLRSL